MTAKRYNIGTLGTAARTLVEAAEGERIRIEQIWVCNNEASVRKVTITHVPAGDDSAVANFNLWNEVALRADTTQVIDTQIYMDPGDRITAFTDAADDVVITMYGRSSV
mgnify:FL=1